MIVYREPIRLSTREFDASQTTLIRHNCSQAFQPQLTPICTDTVRSHVACSQARKAVAHSFNRGKNSCIMSGPDIVRSEGARDDQATEASWPIVPFEDSSLRRISTIDHSQLRAKSLQSHSIPSEHM
ncbi:unnamed protein product, partial [Protopolystoma xenopodis]